ncbi:pilus assembly protein HicB [Azospirillum sp. SYSU D00513]|uniref:pilus assembly protein HicB n=1 Tax=Azospirillum sp. SYSU D00513 TaxID=2812561 RepID=UPI001A96656F|nr:pilus assembly protein HicB [Azospirillum sp. SYSU D00513]
MKNATIPVQLPEAVHEMATRLAQREGVSLDQWVAAAIKQRIEAQEDPHEFLRRRAGNATGEDMAAILARVRPGPPVEGDEIPPDLLERFRKQPPLA